MLDLEALGDADIAIGPLRIWIHGREFESSQCYWDGNILRITAYCSSPHASAFVPGSILHVRDLQAWRDAVAVLYDGMTGTAELSPLEPDLSASIELKDGRGELRITITPESFEGDELHRFAVEMDQSYLPALIRCLDKVLAEYPLRGLK